MRAWFVRVLGLWMLCLPSVASAAAKPVQVLVIQTEDAVPQAQALTAALKAAMEDTSDFVLAKGDYSLEVMTLALGCSDPPDATCLTRIADKIEASAFVWGQMKKVDDQVVTSLHLWQREGAEEEVTLRYSAKLTDPKDNALKRAARSALAKLTREDAGADAASLEKENQKPGAAATTLDTPSGAVTAEGTSHQASSNVLAYTALAVGAAAIGGGVYSAIRVHQIDQSSDIDNYRKAFRSNHDICEEAERGTVVEGAASPNKVASLCDEAHRFEILQYALFGLGAVGIGTGVILLVNNTGNSEHASARPQLVPQIRVSSHGAHASLRVYF